MKKLLLIAFLLIARTSEAFTGCHNLTLATGWTCIDSGAVSGTGLQTTTLTLNNSEAVQIGDIALSWSNLVTTNFTTQTLTLTDNVSTPTVFTQYSQGLNSFSFPANQWAGAVFYGIVLANKASGYQFSCTANDNGGASSTCSDTSIVIIRPPNPATSLAEDGVNWTKPALTATGVPSLVVSPSGQTITTGHADLVINGGNSDAAPDQIDSPFTGLDGDGVNNIPMYYLSAAVQSVSGSITGKWYINISADAAAGSFILGLNVGFAGGGGTPTKQMLLTGVGNK